MGRRLTRSRPRVLSGLPLLPAEPTACAAELRRAMRCREHFVREYGHVRDEDAADGQASAEIPDVLMLIDEFVTALLDGSAASRGLYWAMDEDADTWLRELLPFSKLLDANGLSSTWPATNEPFRLWMVPVGHTEQCRARSAMASNLGYA